MSEGGSAGLLPASGYDSDAPPAPRACTPVPSAPSTPRGWKPTAAGVQSSPSSESEAATVHSSSSASEHHDGSASCDDDTNGSSLLAPLAPSAPPSALHRRLGDLRVALRSSLGREAAAQAQLRAVTWQAAEAQGEVTRVKAALCAVESADALSKNGRLHDGTLDCLRGALLTHATQQCLEHAHAAAQAAGDALRAGGLVQEVQAARQAEAQAASSEIAALAEELATARATAQVHAHAAKEAALTAAADAQRAVAADAAAAAATLAAEKANAACEAALQREAAALASRDAARAAAAEANARAEWAEARATALEASTTGAGQLPSSASSHAASSYDAQLRQLRAQATAERERLESALAAALRGEKPHGWSDTPACLDAQAQTETVEASTVQEDEEKAQLRVTVTDLCEAVETAHNRIAVLETQLSDAQRASRRAAMDAAGDAEARANGAWAARLGAAEAAAAVQVSRLTAALAQAQQAAAVAPRSDAEQQTESGDVAQAQGEENDGSNFKVLRPSARPPPPLPAPSAGVHVESVASPVTPAAAAAPGIAPVAAPKSAARAQLEAVAAASAAAGTDLAASRAALAQLWTLLPSATKSPAAADAVAAAPEVVAHDATTTPAPRARKGLLWSAATTPQSAARLAGGVTPKAPWSGVDDSPVSVLSPSALFGAGALRGSAAALAVARAQEAAVAALGR